MAKASFMVVVLAVCAGAAAGVAVQFLNPGPEMTVPGPGAGSGRSAAQVEVENRLDRDTERVTGIEIEIETLKSENADLRAMVDKLAAQIEENRANGATAGAFPAGGMKVTGPDGKPIQLSGQPGMMRFGSPSKGAKLASLPEEERWTKLREELSLDSYQETELKQIAADYRKAMSEMFESEDGGFKIGKIDLGKIMKNKTDADERVKNLLSEDQYKKYQKENYGAAVGLGGGTTVSVSTSFGTSESSEGK